MSTTLPTRRVGKTSLEVTELGFGTVALGLLSKEEEHLGAAAIKQALKRGIHLFDCAPYYGNGRAEHRLGDALRDVPRSEYKLVSKVGRVVNASDVTQPNAWQPPFDYSYDGVMRSFETSLRRLRVGSIDALLLHDIGRVTHGERHAELFKTAMDSGYRALDELKRSGAVTAIGIGVNEWQVLEEAMGVADFDVFLLAGRYTLLEQTSLDTFLPMVQRKGASVFVGGPFNSGILAKGPHPGVWYNYAPAPEAILERVRAIQAITEKHGVPLPNAALRFPVAHPAVASVVFGPKTAEELDTNVDQFTTAIPPAMWRELADAGLLRADAPLPA
jgi:D-threo-aldose 1-dehydrogenase